MEYYYITKEDFVKFLAKLSRKYKCFIPEKINQVDYHLIPFPAEEPLQIVFNEYRTVEPLKTYLYPAQEEVAEYFQDVDSSKETLPTCLVGVKSCDLFSLKIQDFVFLEGEASDPKYLARRKKLFIISSDCTAFKEVCFCLALEILPHPSELFDINLSILNDGFIVEVGSQLGKDTINEHNQYFRPANSGQLAGRKMKREKLIEDIKKHIEKQHLAKKDILQRAVKQGYNSNIWPEEMLTCVECGACNFICCTCHCFLLSDNPSQNVSKRIRQWDSCQYANFARVAGGANPLKLRRERLRNRFMKKFDFFPDVLGLYACTGCGRCIEACPAKIDIRRILKNLANEKSLPTY
ncbi:MAG: 4Fe-4S dicluster domain-containing protein [Candidatus Omnitrophota bacterium]|nr:4Fe-4S dicluster domain-containing protein [Candidatus Omnitrophota bacterium]